MLDYKNEPKAERYKKTKPVWESFKLTLSEEEKKDYDALVNYQVEINEKQNDGKIHRLEPRGLQRESMLG